MMSYDNSVGADAFRLLSQAVAEGSPVEVKAALAGGADPNGPHQADPWSPLMRACSIGDPEKVKLLLDAGADVEFTDTRLNTPLCAAVGSGSMTCVELLLEHGARIGCRCDCGTVLAVAVITKHEDLIPHLIAKGANPNTPNRDGTTPLMLAASYGMASALSVLLVNGASPNQRDPRGLDAYDYAVSAGESAASRQLAQSGKYKQGKSAAIDDQSMQLDDAINFGTPADLKAVLSAGADSNGRRPGRRSTPLIQALQAGELEKSRLLLKAGADIRLANADGNSPLCVAVASGSKECIDLLLDQGADIACQCDCGSVLAVAVLEQNLDLIPYLIAKGCLPTKRTNTAIRH